MKTLGRYFHPVLVFSALVPCVLGCNTEPGRPPSEVNPCDAGEFYYDDKIQGGLQMGDLHCHRRCDSGADCVGLDAATCAQLGLWHSGDYNRGLHISQGM
jgi:hypothetical protein